MRKILGVTLLVLVTGSSAGLAAEPFLPRQERSFNRVDANKDQKIDLNELKTIAARRFARFDTNGDKSVSSAEVDKLLQDAILRRRERMMAFMDRNADGIVTQSELDNLVEAMFNSADLDRNGGVTLVEAQGFKRAAWRRGLVGQTPN
jgi:Ca2+-binding EF-hand superfamily protein